MRVSEPASQVVHEPARDEEKVFYRGCKLCGWAEGWIVYEGGIGEDEVVAFIASR